MSRTRAPSSNCECRRASSSYARPVKGTSRCESSKTHGLSKTVRTSIPWPISFGLRRRPSNLQQLSRRRKDRVAETAGLHDFESDSDFVERGLPARDVVRIRRQQHHVADLRFSQTIQLSLADRWHARTNERVVHRIALHGKGHGHEPGTPRVPHQYRLILSVVSG